MNNTFTRYCLAFIKKKKKKNACRNIIYFIYADNLCIYYNAFLCVTVSDILKIIIWNHNTCIKLARNFDSYKETFFRCSCVKVASYHIRCRFELVNAGFIVRMSEYVFDTSVKSLNNRTLVLYLI